MLRPGSLVWIRYSGIVSCGELVHCMPELNMYTVRPDSDGSTRLVTRGIEDILPVDRQGSPTIPPDDDEWESNFIACESQPVTFDQHEQLLSCCGECGVSLASVSSPLFIDATERSCSRVSPDDAPSGGPLPFHSGMLSTSPVSFTLSPPVPDRDVSGECAQPHPAEADTVHCAVSLHPSSQFVPITTNSCVTVLSNNNASLGSQHLLSGQSGHDTREILDTSGSNVRSIDFIPLKAPPEADWVPRTNLGNTIDASSTHVLFGAIRGVLQWAESLVASRQSFISTEPIHQVALCALNEANQLLLSLSSYRSETNLRSRASSVSVRPSVSDDMHAGLTSPVSELVHDVHEAAAEEAKSIQPLVVPVSEGATNLIQPTNRWWKKRQQDCSILNDDSMGVSRWQSSTGPPPEKIHASPPTPVERCLATAGSRGLFYRMGTDPSDKSPESVVHTLDLGSRDPWHDVDQTPNQGTSALTFPACSSGHYHHPLSIEIPSSHTATPEPGAHPKLSISSSISSADLLTTGSDGSGNGGPIGTSLSVVTALRTLSGLCQNESESLCASLTELLQKLSSILIILSGQRAPGEQPVLTGPSPAEPCDRIPITHLTLVEEDPVTLGQSLTATTTKWSHSYDTERPCINTTDVVWTSMNSASFCTTSVAVCSQSANTASTSTYYSPRLGLNKPTIVPAKQVEEVRRDVHFRQVSKRNRTNSASALVQLSSSVAPSSLVPFNVSSVRKTHRAAASLDTTRSVTAASSEMLFAKRCGLTDTNVASVIGATNSIPVVNSGHVSATSTTGPLGRSDVKKCRKVYGIEHRDQWCNQCRWKKACRRFPDPANVKACTGGALKSGCAPTDSKACLAAASSSVRQADRSGADAAALVLQSCSSSMTPVCFDTDAIYSRSAPATFGMPSDIHSARIMNKRGLSPDKLIVQHSFDPNV